MSTTYFLSLPTVCSVLDTQVSKFCLPIKKRCGIDPDGIITICGTQFNCTLCCGEHHEPYYIPYDGSEPIILQTQFFDRLNSDPTSPDEGFGSWITIDIIDSTTGLVVGDHTDFGIEYFVGWNGTNSYQLLKIYPTTVDFPQCWSIKYHVYRNIGGDTEEYPVEGYCSEEFRLVNDCINGSLYTIEGLHDTFDCEGNYYGDSLTSLGTTPFKYENTIQILGYEEQAEPERETTIKNGIVKTEKIKYKKRIIFPMIPLYMVKYIEDRVFNARQVLINGEFVDVEIENTVSVTDLCVYNYSINVITSCKTNNC